jgi:hypothetical protein
MSSFGPYYQNQIAQKHKHQGKQPKNNSFNNKVLRNKVNLVSIGQVQFEGLVLVRYSRMGSGQSLASDMKPLSGISYFLHNSMKRTVNSKNSHHKNKA